LKIRIALSDYLNSAPLGWSFLHGPLKNRFDVFTSVPAQCAEQLARGEVEIGLIPSIEYQRIPNLHVIPGIAVASSSKVRSVLMVQCRQPGEIRRVALDTNSRTSVVLSKLLLELKMGLQPTYFPHAPDLPSMLNGCDAAVIIGDRALKVSPEEYYVTDLAEAWISWQQRPFVFALWACRSDSRLPSDLLAVFQQAKEYGLRSRPEIAGIYSKTLGLPESLLNDYLFDNVDYELGPRHIEGLEKFYSLASEHDLIADLKTLRFLNTVAPVVTGSL
jgi:chorismate dehydratase